jgi:hypothetical protein
MNAVLEKALSAVAQLPEAAQESIANLILDEIEAERQWDQKFAGSQSRLAELARRAWAETESGDVMPYDPSDRPKK